MVRFAHVADCHVGAWRDERLSVLADEALAQAVDRILEEAVDFVIIAGDLFNTALPAIDRLKKAVRELERLKRAGIRVYFVAGSHDYSPTGKTMLDVLEEAGLGVNVFRGSVEDGVLRLDPVVDEPTGVSLTGILGRAGQLDSSLFEQLDEQSLLAVPDPKVFVFHAALREITPRQLRGVDTHSVSFLPKGFQYYAGGHVHVVDDASVDGYDRIVYPGPLFPASFSELEELRHGGFYLYDLDVDALERVPVVTKQVVSVRVDCAGLGPDEVSERLSEELDCDVEDRIVLVRVSGRLARGTASDISFRELFSACENRGAYACLKNTAGVSSPQLLAGDEVEVSDAEHIERDVVERFAGGVPFPGLSDEGQEELLLELLRVLSQRQGEGETKKAYERRVCVDALEALGVENK